MSLEVLDKKPTVLAMYPRAIVGGFLPKKSRQLPDATVRLAKISVDRKHLADYCKVCGFANDGNLPATYPHMLAFPLHMALMTRLDFPFPLLGLVHVSNSITQHRRISANETLDVECCFGQQMPHDKGIVFSVMTVAKAGQETVWESESAMLFRTKSGGNAKPGKKTEADSSASDGESWAVPEDIGRRYGRVSGDMNPIHLHALTAKLFGFPKAIAHGMWTKARSLASLSGSLPEAFTVDVQFKLPVLLPATVVFSHEDTTTGLRFQLRDQRTGKPHLSGTVTKL